MSPPFWNKMCCPPFFQSWFYTPKTLDTPTRDVFDTFPQSFNSRNQIFNRCSRDDMMASKHYNRSHACPIEGPLLHQRVIFFGAHFSNLIICVENKLGKVRDMSFISKYLRPTLNFHIVKHYFYIKNTFYYVKSKHWARPLRDLEIIYNFA